MATQDAPSNPAADALTAEMQDIMTNSQHPLHAGYHRNDPAVMKEIDGKYQKVYGTKPVEIGGGSIDVSSEAGDLDWEMAAQFAPALTALEQEWGRMLPANLSLAHDGLTRLYRDLGIETVEDALGQVLEAQTDPAAVMKELAALGRALQTDQPFSLVLTGDGTPRLTVNDPERS